ncbi:MAG: hypothetical protein HWE15_09415 [Algoriphagus sp.]|uniref:hypothetical protein n=1 Tax=Algoriphagus sp. TaxID=1872435 RepID=UPI0017F1A67A|nr:hypothetical protein [Algoriphagus sp.]NVJ86509.1 hypothetical protein [Algoriphagus sp.]
MKNYPINLIFIFLLFWGCKPSESLEDLADELEIISEEPGDSQETQTFTEEDQKNIQRLIQLTLGDLFQEELAGDFLDSLDRRYMYDQVDLNADGNKEILVGLAGPYFCGSGGCTLLLLTNHGDVITRFSVVKYPVFIDQESTNGWKNLILYSGSENRLVTFDGQTYPSNPSTLEVYGSSIDELSKILEWESNNIFSF